MATSAALRKCPAHPGDHAMYVCLDPECPESRSVGCVHCVREAHSNCADDFLIEEREVFSKIETLSAQVSEEEVDEALHNAVGRCSLNFQRKAQKVASLIKQRQAELASTDPSSLIGVARLKQNFSVARDPSTNKLVLSLRTFNDESDVEATVRLFRARAAQAFRALSNLASLCTVRPPALDFSGSDWAGSKEIEVSDEGGRLVFSRQKENSSNNYYGAFYRPKLTQPVKFKLTVLQIHESDRFLDFGIVSKSLIGDKPEDQFMLSFNSGAVSFCGYSMSSVEGKLPTTSSNSPEGLKKDDVVYLEFKDPGTLLIYNDDRSIDLCGLNLETDADYHLFVVLYYPDTECAIERLS